MEVKRARVHSESQVALEHEDAVLEFLLEQDAVQHAMEAWRNADAATTKNLLFSALQGLLKQRDKETRIEVEVTSLRSLIAEYMAEFKKVGVTAAAGTFMRNLMGGNLVSPEVVVKEVVNYLWPRADAVQGGAELIALLVVNGGAKIHIIQETFNTYLPRIGDTVSINPKAPEFFFILLAEIANKASVDRVPTDQIASLVRFLVGDNVAMLADFAQRTTGRARRWAVEEIAALTKANVSDVERSLAPAGRL